MATEIISKRCSKCKETKPLSEFHKDTSKKDGHRFYCKMCQRDSVRKYDQSDRGKAKRKQYTQSEKGKVDNRKAVRKYSKTEKCRIVQKRHRQTEKYKARAKFYEIRNPQKIKAKTAVRRAIEDGRLPRPDSLQCHYGEHPAKQYHHWYGYAPEHWLDVIPVCYKCHRHHTHPCTWGSISS